MLGTVTVSASGYGTAYYRWPPTTSARTLSIELEAPATVSGTVYDISSSRDLVANVTLTMTASGAVVSDGATTDENGGFAFEDLLSGSGSITAYTDGYAPRIINLPSVTNGVTNNVRMGLQLQAAASGTVVDSDGDSVSGANVFATYDSLDDGYQLESFISGRVYTASDGVFTLESLVPDTTVTVWAELDDGTISNALSLTIAPGMIQENLVIAFQ